MNYKKIIALIIGLSIVPGVLYADEMGDMKVALSDMMMKLIQKYETKIQSLETENTSLKAELEKYKALSNTGVAVLPTSPITPPVVTNGKTDTYNALIKYVNANIWPILKESSISGTGTIGLFEFIEPNAVFISIDDGNNPTNVTAFKSKVLYTFDSNLTMTRIGLFDLDYATGKYVTLYGSNPYVKSVRIRMQNPLYKGRLFDVVATTTTNTGASNTIQTVTPQKEVTLADIKAVYTKNKLLDAIKLSDSYIAKNPNDLDVLRIRYRSYYMIGKYDESLSEVKKIEALETTGLEKGIACDAAVIGKIAKKKDVSDYYGAICKKK